MAQDWRYNMNPRNAWGNYGINNLNQAPVYNEAPVYKDRIQDIDLMVNQEYEDSLQDINTNPRYDDTEIYMKEPGETLFAENRGNPIKNLFNKDTNIFGYQKHPNDFNFPSVVGGIMKALVGGKRSPENQAFYDSVTGGKSLASNAYATGDYKGNQYGIYNSPSGLKVGSDIIGWGEGFEKNMPGTQYGSEDIKAMEDKKIEWALARMEKFKGKGHGLGISQRLYNALLQRGIIGDNIAPSNIVTTQERKIPIGDNVNQGGSTYGGPPTVDFNRAQAVKAGSYDRRGGPMVGSYGPYGRAEGGRIGYANGEFVDEDINIQGPGFDVNENIEMASNPNPLAELNAFSLEIFKKPFDQLNDDERDILFEMMNDQAAGPQGEEAVEEGIASLV